LRFSRSVNIFREMSIDEIRTLKHAKPFRPFDIVTRDGQVVDIELPIRIALSPKLTIRIF